MLRKRIRSSIIAGSLLLAVLSLAIAYGFWPRGASPAAVEEQDPGWPRIVSESELRAFGVENGPIYWAGPQDDAQYELTRTAAGFTYIRYVDEPAAPDAEAARYLTVATYPDVSGYENLVQASAIDGSRSLVASDGAMIVEPASVPTSVYFAFEDGTFQVEVYSPVVGEAAAAVYDGTIELLR